MLYLVFRTCNFSFAAFRHRFPPTSMNRDLDKPSMCVTPPMTVTPQSGAR